MFGSFPFGGAPFGGEEFISSGQGATATFTGFQLTLSLRSVTASTPPVSGGGSGQWPRYVQFIERVSEEKEATVVAASNQLSLRLGKVSVSAAALAQARAARISVIGRRPGISAGASAVAVPVPRIYRETPGAFGLAKVNAGAVASVAVGRKVNQEEEELLLIATLLAALD